jgi:hypothetical protein
MLVALAPVHSPKLPIPKDGLEFVSTVQAKSSYTHFSNSVFPGTA